MPEITNVNELSGEPLTAEQIRGMVNAILVQLYNLMIGNGTYGGVDEEENGPAGSKAYPSRTIKELREAHKYFMGLLDNPDLWDSDEVRIYVSQWDNPAL